MNESLSSMIVPGVLWALVVFSVLSWGLLLIKSAQYLKLKKQNRQFTKAFWAAPDLLTAAEHSSQYPRSTRVRWHASPTPVSKR
jgi:biopolymer transport protein ExbB